MVIKGRYRVLVSHGHHEFLLGGRLYSYEAAMRLAEGEFKRRRAEYDKRTGRRGMPPVVRVLRAVEELH